MAREVEIFTARSDHIVPIVFGQRFVDADRERFPLLRSIPDSQLAIEELVNNLDEGPSEGVVEQLLRTHRVLRRRVLRAQLVTGVIATLATAVVVVGFSWWREQASRRTGGRGQCEGVAGTGRGSVAGWAERGRRGMTSSAATGTTISAPPVRRSPRGTTTTPGTRMRRGPTSRARSPGRCSTTNPSRACSPTPRNHGWSSGAGMAWYVCGTCGPASGSTTSSTRT